MKDLKVPLVCVCGNHDVGDRPNAISLKKYRSLYGRDWFGFWCGGVRFLVINSQLLNDGRDALEEQAEQASWLQGELEHLAELRDAHASNNNLECPRHVVMFQHIPWYLRSETEPLEGYYNLSPSCREEWLSKLYRAGVTKVFCGHYHRNSTAYSINGLLEVVVTSAVGRQLSEAEVVANAPLPEPSDTKSGVRLVHVKEHVISHEYVEFDEWEAKLDIRTL